MPDFERILSESTARGSNNVPGCVIAAIDHNGDKFYSKASGYESVAPGAPEISSDGVFWIASCSKLIGTIAALQCVERGQISLDEPVERILPELANLPIIKPVESGSVSEDKQFMLEPSTKKITLRQLLTHTSGLANDTSSPLLELWRKSRQEKLLAMSGMLIKACVVPLLFEPGEGWAYSGGIDLAGELVARLNKVTLEQYMQTYIFGPLGMSSTTFRLKNHPELEKRLVKTTRRSETGILIESDKVWPLPAADDCAGAGLYSTSDDYLRVLHDLLQEEPILLKASTVKAMFAPQLAKGSPALQSLQNSSSARAMTGIKEAHEGLNFGLGGAYTEEDVENNIKGSLIWGGYPNLVWFANRAHGVAGLYASQVLPPMDPKSLQLARAFIDHIWQIKA